MHGPSPIPAGWDTELSVSTWWGKEGKGMGRAGSAPFPKSRCLHRSGLGKSGAKAPHYLQSRAPAAPDREVDLAGRL